MRIFLAFSLFFLSASVFAQLERTLHQTFSLDSIDQVQVDLTGEVTCETWAGAGLLTETHVELYNASKDLLTFFVEKQERYLVEEKRSAPSLQISSAQSERRAIQYRGEVCTENVRITVYVPEEFEISGNQLTRKPD